MSTEKTNKVPMHSVSGFARICDKTRATIIERLRGLRPIPGPKGSKLYPAPLALALIYQAVPLDHALALFNAGTIYGKFGGQPVEDEAEEHVMEAPGAE